MKPDLEKFTKEIDGKIGIMLLTQADDENGQPFYIYLSITPNKYAEYIAAHLAGKSISFAEFGEILKTGPGYPPPKNVMAEMAAQGFNHNFEQEFNQELMKQLQGVKGKHTLRAKREKNYPYAKPEGEES